MTDQVVRIMAMKYAQRRTVEDLALELGAEPGKVQRALGKLKKQGLAGTWPDGAWGLTSEGNMKRNHLTA